MRDQVSVHNQNCLTEEKRPGKNIIKCYAILVLGFELMCAEVKINIDFGLIRLVECSDNISDPANYWGGWGNFIQI